MRVSYECNKGIMKFSFFPEADDILSYQKQSDSFKSLFTVSLAMRKCEIHLPQNWTLSSVHPDILALAAVSIIYPFSGPKIILPVGVSSSFHNTFKKMTGKEILPINSQLNPRKVKANVVPAIAYSGGIDSTAVSALLPTNSYHLYTDRIMPKQFQKKKTLLNKEAAYYACDSMKKLGRSVHKIKTDLEYVRNPVGNPTFLAEAVPCLLLADYFGFDSFANGHTLDGGYRVGYNGYQDAKETPWIKIWGEMLKAVDMPFSLPVMGLSEVSTSIIAIKSHYDKFAEACARGKVHQPCMNCYKCFRKNLLERVIKQQPIDDHYLDRLFKIKEAQKVLQVTPIHFGNVITYITSKYSGDHQLMNLLKKKTRGNSLDTSWMEKWNPSSLEFIAPKYQEYVKKEISKYVDTMNKQNQENMKNFNYKHLTDSSEFASYDKTLEKLFSDMKNK